MFTHYFKTLKDSELKVLDQPRTGTWTHVVAPTDEEIDSVVREYALDAAVVEDARDFFEVPRMERTGGVTYFFTRYPYEEKDEDIDTAPILFAIGESFVLTVVLREVLQFKPFINGKVDINTTQKTKLFIQFMDTITKSYETEMVRMRRLVHHDRVKLRKIGPRDIQRLVNYENELNNAVAALVPTNAWLNQLTGGNYIQLYNEDVELMEDLIIANNQLVDSSRAVLKTIQNVRNASEAIMTSTLNTTIQRLTILTIILTIPTIVASIYGMNVPIPYEQSFWSFWFVLGLITVLVLVAMYIFKKNEWL